MPAMDTPALPKLSSKQFQLLYPRIWVIDLRLPELFAQKHIARSINVPMQSLLTNWTRTVVPLEVPIVLIISKEPFPVEALRTLKGNGYQNLLGYLEWEEIQREDLVFDRFPLIPATEVMEGLKQQTLYVLDVRTPAEWNAGHIPGALHVELAQLTNALEQLPHTQPLAVVCGAGFRASVAASFLKRAGFHQVCHLPGGMQAWLKAGLPVIA